MTIRTPLENLIDDFVCLQNFPLVKAPDLFVSRQNLPPSKRLDLKIELLKFVLDRLQHDLHAENAEVSFEDFMQCDVNVQGDRLFIAAPSQFVNIGTGTTSKQLQAPLLLFLLLNHQERYKVLDIIQYFVEQIRNELTYLDFKKTKTGVIRCFTNTRFAAHVLRNYGLLKFTHRDAFKTWELSLSGFLVAADILVKRRKTENLWELRLQDQTPFELVQEIRQGCEEIKSFDAFVARLSSICKPDAEIFTTFNDALEEAHYLLQEYWAILSDETKTHEERRAVSLERLTRLEGLGEPFFQELSRCIQINDLLRTTVQGQTPEELPS